MYQHISQFTSHKSVIRFVGRRRVGFRLHRCFPNHCRNRSASLRRAFQRRFHFLYIYIVKGIGLSGLRRKWNSRLLCLRLSHSLRFFHRFTDTIILTAEACFIQTDHDFLQCSVEVHGVC